MKNEGIGLILFLLVSLYQYNHHGFGRSCYLLGYNKYKLTHSERTRTYYRTDERCTELKKLGWEDRKNGDYTVSVFGLFEVKV